VSAAPDHLRALRASVYICVESLSCAAVSLVSRCGQRSQPVAASSIAALIVEGNDSVEGIKEINLLSVSSRSFAASREDCWG
jgi:hypothetical protein